MIDDSRRGTCGGIIRREMDGGVIIDVNSSVTVVLDNSAGREGGESLTKLFVCMEKQQAL